MKVYFGLYILLLLTFSSFAKEISLENKNIRFFNSDIELSKVLVQIFEKHDFKSFKFKNISHLSYKFKSNKSMARFEKPLRLLSKINKVNNKSKGIDLCKEFNTLTRKQTISYRVSVYCFNKFFNSKMDLDSFYKLSAATGSAFTSRRIKKQVASYLRNHGQKRISPTKLVKKTKDIDEYTVQAKNIRKIINKKKITVKDKKELSDSVMALEKILSKSGSLKSSARIKTTEYLVKSLNRHDLTKDARRISKLALKERTNIQDVFYFELLWSYVSRNQYKAALEKVIKEYDLESKQSEYDNTKLKFWVAHTLEFNKTGKYKKIYQNIVDHHPLSFYALVSYDRIKKKHRDTKLSLIDSETTLHSNKKFKFSTTSMDQLAFIRGLIVNNSISLLSNEVSSFIKNNQTQVDKEALYISMATLLQKNNSYLESFKILYRGITKKIIAVDNSVLKLLYPRPYLNIISKQTKNFDSYLALSLMRQESSFNILANSRVGARGLMQLMPRTAKDLKRSLVTKELYNPKTNIKLGVKYLNKLTKRFNRNFVHTLSAYNAGERNVNKWRKNYFTSDSLLKNIENIPFSETQKYVKLIYRNIYYYNYLDQVEGRKPATNTNRLFEKYLQAKR